MPLARWRQLSTVTRGQNPWWTYRLDRFQLPSGKQGEYHYVHTGGSVMVVGVRQDGRLLMVNQYRYLLDRESLEFPGGSIKLGHTPDDSARAELAEETGLAARVMESVGQFNPYNGVTDEFCHVFLARDLEPAPSAEPDETEEFELLELTVAELDARVQHGAIWDGMTLAAWLITRPRLVEQHGSLSAIRTASDG